MNRRELVLEAIRFLPLLGIVACSSLATRTASNPIVLRGSNEEIRERLLTLIPIGTPQEDAERIAIDNGLRCSAEVDSKTNEPYLSCGWSRKSGMWVTWVWQIRIDCVEGRVSDISCKQYGTGP
jgi:hypothetical protein